MSGGLKKFSEDAKELASDSTALAKRLADKTKELGSESIQKISGSKDKKKGAGSAPSKKVFGVQLDPHSKELPLVLAKSLEYFQVKGLRHEGLFRLSGSQIAVQSLKERFDSGENVDMLTIADVHTVSSLLKLWFRELPEPLLTYELYDCFLAAAAITPSEGARHAAKSALKALPPCHYLTVKHLMAFLDLVQRDAEVNKMTPSNLALVFAPNLLRPAPTGTETDAILMLQDTPMANRLLEMFVLHYEELFEATKNTPLMAPVTEPQRKIDFVWRSSRPPTHTSPLDDASPAELAAMAAASAPAPAPLPALPSAPAHPPVARVASPPAYIQPPHAPAHVPVLASAAPAITSPGVMQSVYYGAPPDLTQSASAPPLSPTRSPLPKVPTKQQPAPPLPKRAPNNGPPAPPSSGARPVLQSSGSGSSSGLVVAASVSNPSLSSSASSASSASASAQSPVSSPATPQKAPIVHRRSRSTDTPPALPPRSAAVQSYAPPVGRGPSVTQPPLPALKAKGAAAPQAAPARASVKQMTRSFEV